MPQVTIDQAMQLALQHHQAGRLQQAEQVYRQILAQQPRNAAALHNLGVLAHGVGRNDIAAALIGRAVALRPDDAGGHSCLGNVLRENGQFDEAIAVCRKAIALDPNLSGAFNNLGYALIAKGQLDEAIAACRRAIALQPGFPEAHINLGNALSDKGRLDEAIAAYRLALAVRPAYVEAHNNLGTALRDSGQLKEAIAAVNQAIALDPGFVEAHNNLGGMLRDIGQLDQAVTACRRAMSLDPGLPEAHNNLGNCLALLGEHDQAIAAYRRAIALRPSYIRADSNLLMTMHYHADLDARDIALEHRRWNEQHAEPLKGSIQAHANDRSPERQLRIGYVSPDFREHAVAPMLLPLLQSHDREKFQVFCYAQVLTPDAMTERFRSGADQWRNTSGLSDEQMASLVRQDQIDVLVDLAGHTTGNRLLVFARKPAPVQVTRQGYPNTTGMTSIEYRMTDAHADPPGFSDTLHSEQLVRLPHTNWIYQPPEDCPPPDHDVSAGSVTFGCFNNFAKVTEPMLRVWAKILAAVPGSRMLMKAVALASPDVQRRLRRVFQEQGVAPDRVELVGWTPAAAEHVALYNQVAIALDTFPYHGTTTTCEALWMGVPVITRAGQTHVSRVGVSLLTNLGLPELVAQSPQDYVRIAAQLAADLPRLRDLHATLRSRMLGSPLMDAQGFARDVEAAYRDLWRRWCNTGVSKC